jgi:flagellum-specific peptidoglycan hydrolase FlgJ
MIKRNLLFIATLLIVSCNTSKSVIQTTRKDGRSNNTVVSVNKKSAVKKTNNSKTTSANTPKIEILEATSRVKVTNEMILAYINTYKTVAQTNMKKYGIPASIILGQALLESGSGTGNLCVQANNHFGIKCNKDWSGASVRYDDDAVDECFRKYNNPLDSFRDHSLFLSGKTRYASLFNLGKTDYKTWAEGLKEAGYATDPQYPTKLITLIEKYQLYKYDIEEGNVLAEAVSKKSAMPSESDRHLVAKGDTLYSISKKYDIPIDDLKRNNRLENDALAIGQTINILK